MEDKTDSFWREINEGEINFRDDLQFELKSDFILDPSLKENVLTQEFYIFIPTSLHINRQSYPKEQFWLDQTNLIRYKTPTFTFKELLDETNSLSPLSRLNSLESRFNEAAAPPEFIYELQLLANIFRSAIRRSIIEIIKKTKQPATLEQCASISREIKSLLDDIEALRAKQLNVQNEFKAKSKDTLTKININHIDEFFSNSIDFFLTGLLNEIRDYDAIQLKSSDILLCSMIRKEKEYRERNKLVPKKVKGSEEMNESILYRIGILEKYMLEPLMLKSYRKSWVETHGHYVGAFAAGFAMLVYMILFAYQASAFVITSTPFILLAVVFYILKDRLKEGIKNLFYKQAFRWLPDFSTDIVNSSGRIIGKLSESFQFIDEKDLPPGFLAIRHYDFHEELQSLHRYDNIIRYKRQVKLFHIPGLKKARRKELNIIFRLNIERFLSKASNEMQPSFQLDPISDEIAIRNLPKVYHLNMIMKESHQENIDIRKFRVVVDKRGIKRVEQI